MINANPNLVKQYGALAVFTEFIALAAYDTAHGGNYALRQPVVNMPDDLQAGIEEATAEMGAEEIYMTHPIPPELLARIEAHERWLETTKREGQELAQGNMDLSDLDLSGRHLGMSILPDVRLDRAVLCGTTLSDSNLRGASLVEALMDNAWLVETDAWKANLSGASLREVRGVSLELQEANLQKADLTSGNFSNADFSEANLEYANFSHVNLREAYFYEARMAHITLTGASFWNAKLAGATGLELAEIEWIDISQEKSLKRLEGEAARRWLLEEAAKPLPHWWKS